MNEIRFHWGAIGEIGHDLVYSFPPPCHSLLSLSAEALRGQCSAPACCSGQTGSSSASCRRTSGEIPLSTDAQPHRCCLGKETQGHQRGAISWASTDLILLWLWFLRHRLFVFGWNMVGFTCSEGRCQGGESCKGMFAWQRERAALDPDRDGLQLPPTVHRLTGWG